jgi:hypothetical protein
MKVNIGPYRNFVGPYQIAEMLCFWVKEEKDEIGYPKKPDWVHDFGTWLSGGEEKDSVLMKLCTWIESKRKRTIKVRIDNYDVWSMDHTLAYIILPMLKKLKDNKHGAPFVDDGDVPEGLRSTDAPPKENEYDTDANHFKRWDWVLDEMIQAFECKVDDSWEDQYHSGVHDIVWEVSSTDENGKPKLYQMKDGPKNTYKCDYEALEKHGKRNQNGYRLFGKYYSNLWN